MDNDTSIGLGTRQSKKSAWKTIGIIFIIISIILGAGCAFLGVMVLKQENKINDLEKDSQKLDDDDLALIRKYELPTSDDLRSAFEKAGNSVEDLSQFTYSDYAQITNATMPNVSGYQTLTANAVFKDNPGSVSVSFYRQDSFSEWVFAFTAQNAGGCTDEKFTEDIVGEGSIPLYILFPDTICDYEADDVIIQSTFYNYYFPNGYSYNPTTNELSAN